MVLSQCSGSRPNISAPNATLSGSTFPRNSKDVEESERSCVRRLPIDAPSSTNPVSTVEPCRSGCESGGGWMGGGGA